MTNNWIGLARYIRGKKVALFGNAKSVLQCKKEIDSQYDIICRMNLGHVKGWGEYIGTRTDILFLSMPVSDQVLKELNPKFIIWATPKHEKMTPYLECYALRYNQTMWQCLYDHLGARPSTGIMALDMLSGLAFRELNIYGYDHWKTVTWYNNKNRPCHHSPKAEEKLIKYIVNHSKGRIIHVK